MSFFDFPLQVKVGLFLFSHGNEIVDFSEDQIEKSLAFAKQRFEEGKAFLEEMLAEYDRQGVLSTPIADVKADIKASFAANNDVWARSTVTIDGDKTICLVESIVEAIAHDPQSLREAIMQHHFAMEPFRVPSDFTFHSNAADNSVAYHVPLGEDRVRYDELTGAGEGEIHAVLDTGIDSSHPDFEGKILGVYSEVPGEDGEDRLDHGTHVSGTLFGPKEICLSHKAKGISIKVLGGPNGSGQSNWIENGINRAVDWRGPDGERVTHINLSLGGGGFHQGTQNALQRAQEAGIIVNAAAGNDGWRRGVDRVNEPGRSVYTFTYGAIDQNENQATFTSPGPLVDGAAAGVGVISTKRGGGRIAFSGTSMATPVGGSESASTQSFLVRHGFARLNGTLEFREYHKEHARDIFDPGSDDTTGEGKLDVYETVLAKRPDDVQGLATLPSALTTRVVAILAVLFSVCNFASAQDTLEVRTVITTKTSITTDEFIGEEKVQSGEPMITTVVEEKFEEVPVVDVGSDAESITTIGSDLMVRKYVATAPGKFTINRPGDYLIFEGDIELPEFKLFTVVAPKPEVDLSGIKTLSSSLATQMNDQPTRSMLIEAYTSASDVTQFTSFEEAQINTKLIVLAVWPRRPFESQNTNWVDGFQRPLTAEFDRLGVNTLELYRLALTEVIGGLKGDTQPSAASITTVGQIIGNYQYQKTGCNPDGTGCVYNWIKIK